MNDDDLLKMLRNGGRIVSTNDLSAASVLAAAACGSMLVDADGFGYVYLPASCVTRAPMDLWLDAAERELRAVLSGIDGEDGRIAEQNAAAAIKDALRAIDVARAHGSRIIIEAVSTRGHCTYVKPHVHVTDTDDKDRDR